MRKNKMVRDTLRLRLSKYAIILLFLFLIAQIAQIEQIEQIDTEIDTEIER
jgi:hypothetical protein